MVYCNYCLCLVTDAETGNHLLNCEHHRYKIMYYDIVLVTITQENVIPPKCTALLPTSHQVFTFT